MCRILHNISIYYSSDIIDIWFINSKILWNQTLEYMWLGTYWNAVLIYRMWMSSFCDTVDVVVVVVRLLWSCLVSLVMRFSASEVCVSWGGASVGGCSACLPVPHSSTTTSHSHVFRGEESAHTSPAHSDPVVHSPRRSESLTHMFYHCFSLYDVFEFRVIICCIFF